MPSITQQTGKMELVLVDDFLPKKDLDAILDAELVADYDEKDYGDLGQRHYATVPNPIRFIIQDALAQRDDAIEQLVATDFSFTRMRVGEALRWHTDNVGERVFAFTLYLNDLDENQGGRFIAEGISIIPKRNRLVAFWVSEESFHCIEELQMLPERIALSGWFSHPKKKAQV